MSEPIASLFASTLLASRDAAVLALLVGATLWVLGRGIAPGWRHLLWMLVAVRLVLPALPPSPISWQNLIGPLSPQSETASPVTAETVAGPLRPSPERSPGAATQPALPLSALALPAPDAAVGAAPADAPHAGPFAILSVIWLGGAFVILAVYLVLYRRFRRRIVRLEGSGHPGESAARRELAALARELGLRETPRFRVSDAVGVPALSGLRRPEIVLPPSTLERLDPAALRLVLLHEFAHLRRRDLWTQGLWSLLLAVHWFNPVLWWAFRRVRIEAEQACDHWALSRSGGSRGKAYGEALLRLLEDASAKPAAAVGTVCVVETSRDLRARMKSIARFTRQRRPLATLLAALAFLGTAAVGLTQAPKDRSAEASPDPGPPGTIFAAAEIGATEVSDPVTSVPSLRDDATPPLLVRDIPVPASLFQGAAEGEWTDPRERLAREGIRLRAYESVAYDATTDRLFIRAEAENQARIFDWVVAMREKMSRLVEMTYRVVETESPVIGHNPAASSIPRSAPRPGALAAAPSGDGEARRHPSVSTRSLANEDELEALLREVGTERSDLASRSQVVYAKSEQPMRFQIGGSRCGGVATVSEDGFSIKLVLSHSQEDDNAEVQILEGIAVTIPSGGSVAVEENYGENSYRLRIVTVLVVDPAGVPLPKRELLEPTVDDEPLELAPGLFPDAPGGNGGERVIVVPAEGDARTDPFELWYRGYHHFQRAKELAISGTDDEVRDPLRQALRVFHFLRDAHPTFQPDILEKRIGIVESLLDPANSGSPQ